MKKKKYKEKFIKAVPVKIKNPIALFFLEIITFSFLIKILKFFSTKVYFKVLSIIARKFTRIIYEKYSNRKLKRWFEKPEPITNDFDLSIAIPAYIRDEHCLKYFKIMLNQLFKALKKLEIKYEVCIYNNASIYELEDLITQYKDFSIKIKNSHELVPPYVSFLRSVKMCKGRYIHIHAIDDFVNDTFYSNFESVIKLNLYEMIYVRAKNLHKEDIVNAKFSWYWNWPDIKSLEFTPKYHFIRNPMPSCSWICKREFYEKYGVMASWINGLDLDLSFRFNIFINKIYFSYDSFIYYRNHESQGNKLDNPDNIKELIWNFIKVKTLYYYDNLTEKEKFLFTYNYILYYCLTHSVMPKLLGFYYLKHLDKKKLSIYKFYCNFLFGKFSKFSKIIVLLIRLSNKDYILTENKKILKFVKEKIIYFPKPYTDIILFFKKLFKFI